MRPEVKQIKQFAKSLPGEYEFYKLFDYNKSFKNMHAGILKSKLIYKLKQPIKIKKGTKWCAKSSSGSISGFFKCDTKLVGITPGKHKQIIFDKCCIVSNDYPDAPLPDFEISVSNLPTDILQQICEQL